MMAIPMKSLMFVVKEMKHHLQTVNITFHFPCLALVLLLYFAKRVIITREMIIHFLILYSNN